MRNLWEIFLFFQNQKKWSKEPNTKFCLLKPRIIKLAILQFITHPPQNVWIWIWLDMKWYLGWILICLQFLSSYLSLEPIISAVYMMSKHLILSMLFLSLTPIINMMVCMMNADIFHPNTFIFIILNIKNSLDIPSNFIIHYTVEMFQTILDNKMVR